MNILRGSRNLIFFSLFSSTGTLPTTNSDRYFLTGTWAIDHVTAPGAQGVLGVLSLQSANEMRGTSQLSPPPWCSLGWTELPPCVPHCPHSGPGQQGPQVQADQ